MCVVTDSLTIGLKASPNTAAGSPASWFPVNYVLQVKALKGEGGWIRAKYQDLPYSKQQENKHSSRAEEASS